MEWDYAELSKEAKKAGGPEKYVDSLIKNAEQNGQQSMYPWVVVATVGGALITAGIAKLVSYFREKKAVSEKELEATRAKLIQGIKDYEAAYPENDAQDENKQDHIKEEVNEKKNTIEH
ncbi:hypothetical protein [Aristaeella lactis]|uniref:Uncharacterized protein n=1 Tax=Aristaeella lactis TaxID=3046383 RepID=A0AC61PLE9_9FIRM|nr:hypothetical protein [Aristaeella lactis]QUA52177.1 hypothetical protein JYE50_10670 [Aristaeella lactis]SMC58442.1 hypothetical protein SAMN06297397_1555 [Aristaeella lactis]